MYRWLKQVFGSAESYLQMNASANEAPLGSDGLRVLPFGNGAERMLNNKMVGAHFHNIDLNIHTQGHVIRAVQEGIAFAFRYGLDIMRENGMNPSVIRAGRANLFLSDLFAEVFVNATDVPVELYQNDGSTGAALGAGIGSGIFSSPAEAFSNMKKIKVVEPSGNQFESIYQDWKKLLENQLNNIAQELKRIHEENEFNEIDLNHFKEKLNKLKEELDKPTNVSLKQQSTSFIDKMFVVIPFHKGNPM